MMKKTDKRAHSKLQTVRNCPRDILLKFLPTLLLFSFNQLLAQDGVGIGITDVDDSAVLHVQPDGAYKGILIPRYSTVDRGNIGTPENPTATGLIIYNTTDSVFNYYDGEVWLTLVPTPANLDINMMDTHKVVSLANGTEPGDAVNREQLDTKVAKAGDSMTGALNMGTNRITNMANGTANGDAVSWAQFNALSTQVAQLENELDDLIDLTGILYVGVHFMGDISETDYPRTITFPSVGTTNYMVLCSMESFSADGGDYDNDFSYVIDNKQVDEFTIWFKDYASVTQSLQIRYIITDGTTRSD